ncbi:MAG: hypothetical protein PF961_20265 [Planctomycetota bacterium]|jgi:serine/threonine protein kinase|nr:hypothetical protein [Planctomycetota bacterium]
MATVPQHMGDYQLSDPVCKPGCGRAYVAVHSRFATPALAVVIPAPRERDVSCEKLFADGWRKLSLKPVDGFAMLHHAELRPNGTGGWEYAAVVDAYKPTRTLAHFVDKRGPMAAIDALRLMRIMVRALVALEQRRLCHGCLGPEQVVLGPGGRPQLSHPVIAQAERSSGGHERVPAGFLAPEIQVGGEVSMAGDIYATGALLHFVSTGHPPMGGSDLSDLHPELLAELRSSRRHQVHVDPIVDSLIQRAMAVALDQRFTSAISFLQAVEQALRDLTDTKDGVPAVDDEVRFDSSGWRPPVSSGSSETHRVPRTRSGSGQHRPRGRRGSSGHHKRRARSGSDQHPVERRRKNSGGSFGAVMAVAIAVVVVASLVALQFILGPG